MSAAYTGRVSRLASSCPKDLEFEYFVYSNEANYNIWCSLKRLILCLRSFEDNTLWNILICFLVLSSLILVAADYNNVYTLVFDTIVNVLYAFHVVVITVERLRQAAFEDFEFTKSRKWSFILDALSYIHYIGYALNPYYHRILKIVCYFMRLQTSFRFLRAMTDSNLKGSVIGTALKYCFIFLVIRLFYSLLWMHIPSFQNKWDEIKYEITSELPLPTSTFAGNVIDNITANISQLQLRSGIDITDDSITSKFIRSAYLINFMFLPVGPIVHPKSDYERIAILFVVITGSFVVTGAAVASLALVISLYMRPEEEFRARFRLIMDEMKSTKVPQELRDKVDAFYRMYWHKQKAVSVTRLLPTFPHTIPCTIFTDIYFEAQQKSPILRDLSYQFLWEVSKVMETTHYIPGDAIIKRDSFKSSIIYITYGDVEMLTAEDDETPILRMTRGTVISPCAGCPALACARALVKIQAATFCIAHVLTAANLWRVATKYGKVNGQAFIILSCFEEHMEKVKRHYKGRLILPVKYKSSIMQFKRNLIALKEAKDDDGKYLLERTDFFLEISGCYIMRNRADSSLTEEADEICLRPKFPCILQPQSSLLVAWHSVVCVLILIISFTHPYYLLYLKTVNLNFKFFDYMITSIFTVDLVVYLSTGANVEEGVPITFMQTSTQQMKSYWFVLDVMGTVPLFEFIGEGRFAGLNKLLRLPKLFRMLKSMEEVCVYHSNILRFMSYTLLMFIVCYLIASSQQGYMCFLHNYCRVRNITHAPFWRYDELSQKVTHRMFFGLYWAISILTFTAHHTNDWNTSDWRNLVYSTILLESITILYTFMEAMYSATIMVTTALKEDYDQTISNVKHFLIRNRVDATIRQRFIRYLQLCWYTDKAFSMTQKKESIFYDLPPHVYQDIVAKQRIKYLLCIPFMKYVNKEDYKAITAASRLFYTSPNEILLNTGDINNEIFIIKQGTCEIYDPDTFMVVDMLRPKQSFGVLECLLRFPAYYTVRAVTHVQIFAIPKQCLMNVLKVPNIKEAIETVKRDPDYLNVLIRREPFLTYEEPPPTSNLARFPLLRKYEPDTEFLQPFTNLGFLSILRYIFPRFTIRPDGTYIYRYEWFRAVCALTSSLMFPSYSYMVLQFSWLYNLLFFLDICAYFDIFQRMLVGYYNERGILVYHPASTAANYIKGPFIVDLIASLPMENLESDRSDATAASETSIETVSFVKQLLMMNRILQLYRLPGAMDILLQYIPREDVLLVIKAIPLFMILLNVLTCFVVFASVRIFIPPSDASRVSWTGWKITPLKDRGGSWINLFSNTYRFNMTESPWNLQLTVYSWVIYEITTTGFNTFKPSNIELLRILFFGMCVGCMMKTYFSVRIISIRANVNKMLANYQESMKDIAMYMKKENLNSRVQAKVMAYYEYNWDKTGGLDYGNVLKLCDQITLRTDAILHLYGHTFAKCPILYHCDVSLLRVVGRSVHGVHLLEGTRLIQKDDVLSDMYIVDYGTLDVKDSKDSFKAIVSLVRGSVFGNMVNQDSVRSSTDFIATSNVHLLQINAKIFHSIIVDFPTVKVFMKKYRPKNENYILGRSGDTVKDLKTPARQSITSTKVVGVLPTISNNLNINSKAAQNYLILVSFLCVYGDIYNAGFQFNHVGLSACLYILDMCFYMKILLHYIMPYVATEGEARDSLIAARKSYIKGEFKYDIISCLPIELFCFFSKSPQDRWRWFSILRLNRLFRIVTINGCLSRHFAKLSINLTLSTLIMTLIWFCLFVHAMACIWYSLGVHEDSIQENSSWLHKNDGTLVCNNMYLCSVYFILTTFIEKGVGDVLPKKQLEVVFTIILELISTMMFMIYVGEFSNIFQYQSFRSSAYYLKYLELQDFLNNNKVSKNLISLVKKYSLHLWKESRGRQMPKFLEIAPPCFKLKIMTEAYMQHFIYHPAFKECEPAFLRQLVGCLQLFTYSPDIYVAKEGEITDSMYVIHRGCVHEIDEDMDQKVAEFNAGQNFGMIHGLVRDLPFSFSYKTVKKSEVLTLKLDSWEHLLSLFPKSRFEIYKNVPDHPYGKPPDDKDSEKEVSLWKVPSVVSQPSSIGMPAVPPPSELREAPKVMSKLPPRITPLAAATAASAGATGVAVAAGSMKGKDVTNVENESVTSASTVVTAATIENEPKYAISDVKTTEDAKAVTRAAVAPKNVENKDVPTMEDEAVTSASTVVTAATIEIEPKDAISEVTTTEDAKAITGAVVAAKNIENKDVITMESEAVTSASTVVTAATIENKPKYAISELKTTENADAVAGVAVAAKNIANKDLATVKDEAVTSASTVFTAATIENEPEDALSVKTAEDAKGISPQVDDQPKPADSTTSLSSLTIIAAPRPPPQYPSHLSLDTMETLPTSSNDIKHLPGLESSFLDDNRPDEPTQRMNTELIESDKNETESLQVKQDIKVTTEVLDSNEKEKLVLSHDIDIREAEKPVEIQNKEIQDAGDTKIRRSTDNFDIPIKPLSVVPREESDDNENGMKVASIEPRRSTVIFQDEIFKPGMKSENLQLHDSDYGKKENIRKMSYQKQQHRYKEQEFHTESKMNTTSDSPGPSVFNENDDDDYEPASYKRRGRRNTVYEAPPEEEPEHEPQLDMETVQHISNQFQRKEKVIQEPSQTIRTSRLSSAIKEESKKEIPQSTGRKERTVSQASLEEYLNQTHKASRTSAHDRIVMKRKLEPRQSAQARMEKRMTKVRIEGDDGEDLPRLGQLSADPELPDNRDLGRLPPQLSMCSLHQLMDSDETTRGDTRANAKRPPPPSE